MNIEEMKKIKIERGYSNEQVAQLSGVPLGTVQKLFAGITKRPRYDTLRTLEKIFQDDPDPNSRGQVKKQPESQAESEEKALTKPPVSSYASSEGSSSAVCESSLAYGAKKQGEYTLEDYYAIPDDRRVELIDGVIYDMAAPTRMHQFLIGEIHGILRAYIRSNNGSCAPFMAPSDVRLDWDDKTMVQPDVFVICSPDQRPEDPQRSKGAPDFVVEVLSPSTRRKDALIKLNKYANAGVREYWMVDPDKRRVIVYIFENDDICPTIYSFRDTVPVAIFGGKCQVNFAEISDYIDEISGRIDNLFDE